jgi:phage-related minor tail protein
MKEIMHLKVITREVIDQTATLEQALQGTNQYTRSVLYVAGKTLKSLFHTALSENTAKLDEKIDEMTQQGDLLHDTTNQMTVVTILKTGTIR